MRDPLAAYRKTSAGSPKGDTTESEGYVAFGAKDNVDRLKIRRVEPPMRAPGYAYLMDLAYDREGTSLVLVYNFLLVIIRGRNLQPVVMAVETSTCDFIQQYDEARWPKPNGTVPIIESIDIEMQESGPSVAESEKFGKTLH
jgi:hypothetical protein